LGTVSDYAIGSPLRVFKHKRALGLNAVACNHSEHRREINILVT
jgi:hypothetical protein